VVISERKGAQGQTVPEFSITVGTSDAVTIDPLTGAARPAQTDVLHYQLEGGMVKRVMAAVPPGAAPVSTKPKSAEAHTHRHHKRKGAGRA
jgi:hypothetical protein